MSDKKSYIQVQGPASPQIRRVLQRMSPTDTKDISKVQVEPTGQPNQLGFVTNKPEEQGVIHIPEQNIKRQLQKAQPGIDPQTLKDQQETMIEDVIIPHERSHVQDVIKNEGEFSPNTEQEAQNAEDFSRLQEEYGLTPKSRFAFDKGLLEKARNMPELAAYPWVANILNKQPVQISSGEWADLNDLVQKIQKSYDGGKSMLKGTPMSAPSTAPTIKKAVSMLDSIANRLEEKGMIKEATQIDVVSNTLADARDRIIYKPDLGLKIK